VASVADAMLAAISVMLAAQCQDAPLKNAAPVLQRLALPALPPVVPPVDALQRLAVPALLPHVVPPVDALPRLAVPALPPRVVRALLVGALRRLAVRALLPHVVPPVDALLVIPALQRLVAPVLVDARADAHLKLALLNVPQSLAALAVPPLRHAELVDAARAMPALLVAAEESAAAVTLLVSILPSFNTTQ
jgi:hypothetical protein